MNSQDSFDDNFRPTDILKSSSLSITLPSDQKNIIDFISSSAGKLIITGGNGSPFGDLALAITDEVRLAKYNRNNDLFVKHYLQFLNNNVHYFTDIDVCCFDLMFSTLVTMCHEHSTIDGLSLNRSLKYSVKGFRNWLKNGGNLFSEIGNASSESLNYVQYYISVREASLIMNCYSFGFLDIIGCESLLRKYVLAHRFEYALIDAPAAHPIFGGQSLFHIVNELYHDFNVRRCNEYFLATYSGHGCIQSKIKYVAPSDCF